MGYLFWAVLWEVCAILACAYYLNIPVLIEVSEWRLSCHFFDHPLCLGAALFDDDVLPLLRLCRVKEKYLEMSFAVLITRRYLGHVVSGKSEGRTLLQYYDFQRQI